MRRLAVAAGVVALLAIGGVAFAQTTGDERIYACVNNGDGTMRQVAGPDVTCNKSSHKLSWSANQNAVPTTTTYTVHEQFDIPANGSHFFEIDCHEGDVATGGGHFTPGADNVLVRISEPRPPSAAQEFTPTGWRVTIDNNETGFAIGTDGYAVCQHTE